ncbi:MAG: hypothetical protein HMLKMBBP_02704 [Planctomycetes bacterium]|nr:hypothetical protein [Planctomycetota bacterium]
MRHAPASESSPDPARDLALVRSILDRTQRRLDPHAFHFVAWGLIVLAWYPLDTWMAAGARPAAWRVALGVASVATGAAWSFLGERRLARTGGTRGEDPGFSRQVGLLVAGAIGAGAVLSFVAGATHVFHPDRIPVMWGFCYAVLAWGMGVLYTREYLFAGVWILAGTVAAMALPEHQGYVLGPAMGLGMAVPGVLTMRRLRARGRPDGTHGSPA